MKIPYLDAHCDTVTRFKSLRECPDTHLDLKRLSAWSPAGQVTALFAPPGKDTEEEFERKHTLLKKLFKDIKGVSFHYHGSYSSHLEAIFARGGRELCETLRLASEYGCRFDAWTEQFNEKAWRRALKDSGIDLSYFALNEIEPGRFMPWNIIDCGVTDEYLLSEYEKALEARTTRDCRYGCNGCGINCHVECRWGGIYA